MDAARKAAERESLRRQYDLLHEIRDRIRRESGHTYEEWAEALTPLTDKIIHRLRALEGQPPYPHPLDGWPWNPAAWKELEAQSGQEVET